MEHIVVDGNKFKPYIDITSNKFVTYTTATKGDTNILGCAAASILSKVAHDHEIALFCKKNPNYDIRYDLSKNKGYGTKRHMEGLKKYGTIPNFHRMSFKPCQKKITRKKEVKLPPKI